MTDPTPLSPAAQAVLDAAHDVIPDTSAGEVRAIAAALRAVAMEVVLNKYQYADWQMAEMIMQEIQAIADELESQ